MRELEVLPINIRGKRGVTAAILSHYESHHCSTNVIICATYDRAANTSLTQDMPLVVLALNTTNDQIDLSLPEDSSS